MVKKNLQVNGLKTLAILLIAGLFAGGIVHAEEELTADELLAQCQDKYAQAEDLWKSKRYGEAKTIYQYVAQNSPDSNLTMKSRIWVAGCDINLDNLSAAKQAIEAVKNDFSTQDGLYAELYIFSDEYVLKSKFDEAKTLLQFIAQNSSDSDLVMKSKVWAAACDIYLDNYSAAEQTIEAVKNDFSTQDGLCAELYSLSMQYWGKGKYDKSKALYEYISRNSSDSDLAIKAQMWVLGCEIKLGDDAAAEQAFDSLCTEYSSAEGFVDQILRICNTFMRQNDPAMALSYINRALEASPDHEKADLLLRAKAECYASMGFTDQADTILDEIAQTDSTNEEFIEALTKVVDSYRSDLTDDNDAKNFYTAVITDHPRTQAAMAAQTGIIFMHFEDGNDVQVLAAYDKLVTEYKGLPRYSHYTHIIPEEYYRAGVDAMKQGNRDVARANFTIAKTLWEKLDIKDLEANLASATLFFAGISSNYAGDPNTAIEYLQKVVMDYPSVHYVSSARYHIPQYAQNLKIKDPAQAQKADVLIERYLKEYIENHPDRVPFQVCLRNLGKFYYGKAQYAQALDRFEQLIEKDYQELGRVVDMMCTCYEQLGSPETADELRATYLQSLNL